MGLSLTKVFSGKTKVKIALVGLDCVGKTTILYKFKLGLNVSILPKFGFNVETLEFNDISFTFFDFFGQLRYQIRPLWRHYFYDIQALIYVVDSADRDRADEAKDELHEMLNQDELRDAVVLVFANKQDCPNAMNSDEIIEKFELHTVSQRLWHIQNTCAITGEGLYEGLDWLSSMIINPIESS